jgi:hypothetical protein
MVRDHFSKPLYHDDDNDGNNNSNTKNNLAGLHHPVELLSVLLSSFLYPGPYTMINSVIIRVVGK